MGLDAQIKVDEVDVTFTLIYIEFQVQMGKAEKFADLIGPWFSEFD